MNFTAFVLFVVAVTFSKTFVVMATRVRAVNFKTCGPEELAKCTKNLAVLTDIGLIFVETKEDLDTVCPDLEKSLSCIHAYSRLCMNVKQRIHFRKLFHSTGSVIHDLCRNGTYQDEFISYAPCVQKVSAETEVCLKNYSDAMSQIQTGLNKQKEMEGAAHRNNHHHHHLYSNSEKSAFTYENAKKAGVDEELKTVCCSLHEYVECSTHAVRKMCGDDAAHFSRGLLDKMRSSLIKVHCTEFIAHDCNKKDATICQPYSTFNIDCNECRCNENGTEYVCSLGQCQSTSIQDVGDKDTDAVDNPSLDDSANDVDSEDNDDALDLEDDSDESSEDDASVIDTGLPDSYRKKRYVRPHVKVGKRYVRPPIKVHGKRHIKIGKRYVRPHIKVRGKRYVRPHVRGALRPIRLHKKI